MRFSGLMVSLLLLISTPAMAILRLAPGATYLVQGKVVSVAEENYLLLNFGSRSEVRLHLKGKLPPGYTGQVGANAEMKVKMLKVEPGSEQAEVLEFRRYLPPTEKAARYETESALPSN